MQLPASGAPLQGPQPATRERRRRRHCPSCGGTSLLRGCRVPGVRLQVVSQDGRQRSGLIGLYSDVCVDCGLTSFYARRAEVADQVQLLEAEVRGPEGGEEGKRPE